MISLDALKSWRSPIGEVLRQVVRGCSSRRTMCHHHSPPFAACEPKVLGLINQMKVVYPRRMLTLLLDAAWVFHAGKRVRGSTLPLWSLTSWYYRYAITPHIAKPGPAYTWHSEPEHVTWNHNSEPTKSVQNQYLVVQFIQRTNAQYKGFCSIFKTPFGLVRICTLPLCMKCITSYTEEKRTSHIM